MYGKHYASTYTGSMYGAGVHVFAVWGYALANKDRDGFVELNPAPLADALGNCTSEDVCGALDYLAAPDPNSRSKEEDGRRLVREGQFLYRVVNARKYAELKTAADRREYMRLKKRESRERQKVEDKETPPKKKKPKKKNLPKESKETWLTPYYDTWRNVYGKDAVPPVGPMLKTLRSLEEKHGIDRLTEQWRAYLCQTDVQYTSVPKFAAGFGGWVDDLNEPAFPDYPVEVGIGDR